MLLFFLVLLLIFLRYFEVLVFFWRVLGKTECCQCSSEDIESYEAHVFHPLDKDFET